MPLILEIMVVSTVIRLLGLVQPFVFQTIIDRVLPFQREATLGLVIVVLALATVFSAALDSVGDYLAGHMGNRLTAELGQRIFRHVLNLPLRFMQDWRVGETIARIGEIETVRGFLTGTISGVALDAIFATVYVAALLTISPSLTLIVVTMLPLQVVAFSVLGPFVRQRMQQSFLAGSRHQSRMVEAFGGPATIKALVTEEVHVGRFQETLEASLDADFRVVKLNIVNRLIGELLGIYMRRVNTELSPV